MISTRKIQRKKRENERGAIFDGTRGSFVFLPLKEFEEIKSKKKLMMTLKIQWDTVQMELASLTVRWTWLIYFLQSLMLSWHV